MSSGARFCKALACDTSRLIAVCVAVGSPDVTSASNVSFDARKATSSAQNVSLLVDVELWFDVLEHAVSRSSTDTGTASQETVHCARMDAR